MSFSTVLVISLAAGVILIVGGGLMMYMGNLVKSAYEIKVTINAEVEDRLTKMAEDLDKKSKWIKRDLLEEIEKIKANLQTDNANKLAELAGPLLNRLDQLEAALRNEHAEWVKAVDSDRAAIANLDNRLKGVTRTVKTEPGAAAPGAAAPPPAAPAPGPAPILAAVAAVAGTPPPAEADKPAGWLPDLGGAR